MEDNPNKIANELSSASAQPVEICRISNGSINRRLESDNVIVERAVTVMVDEVGSFTLICTPSDLEAMAVGFIFSEGMIESSSDIIAITTAEKDQDVIGVKIENPAGATINRNMIIASSCGMCGARTIEKTFSDTPPCGNSLRTGPGLLIDITRQMRSMQHAFEATGGCHAAAVFAGDGKLMSFAEDIGRHNALDKAIGKCLLDDRSMAGCSVALSGRASFEMVAKAARAGIELIAAVSAPSSLAVEAAELWNITLCAFVRPGRANVYTHPGRIDD